MKFTFKTEKESGRYGSFYPTQYHVKLKKVKIGSIQDKYPHRIRLKVTRDESEINKDSPCCFKWVTLKAEFDTIDDAKDFLNENFQAINNKFKLHIEKQ